MFIVLGQVLATILATTLGTLAALGLTRRECPMRATIMAVLISPMVVPIIVSAIGVYYFFAAVGLLNSITGLVLAHTALGAPFVLVTVTATLSGFNYTLMRAAASLGANPVEAFLPRDAAGHCAGSGLRGAVRLGHLVRRGGDGAVHHRVGAAHPASPDVERRPRIHQPDHHGGGYPADRVLDRVAGCPPDASASDRAAGAVVTGA